MKSFKKTKDDKDYDKSINRFFGKVEDQDSKIYDIMSNFDFEVVNKVMVFLDWKWGWGFEGRIPTIEELKETARRLLMDVCEPGVSHISTGGFSASKFMGKITLDFNVESWYCSDFDCEGDLI